jgi:hypothetical protein
LDPFEMNNPPAAVDAACNSVQSATATVAFMATAALWNL